MTGTIRCGVCEAPMVPKSKRHVTCSPECRRTWDYWRLITTLERNAYIARISELEAALHFYAPDHPILHQETGGASPPVGSVDRSG